VGVEVIFRIFNGTMSKGDKINLSNNGKNMRLTENLGILGSQPNPTTKTMAAGNVGYLNLQG